MNDLLSDLQADLQAGPLSRPLLPPAPVPDRGTPAFELRVTPLSWSRPSVVLDDGVAVLVGPVRVGVALR